MYLYQKKFIKINNSLGAIFDKIPCTIAHGLGPNFGANLKIHKKSKCDRIQLKLYKQHMKMRPDNSVISSGKVF